ncbi:hypothetical protein L2091_00700 [Curtobacterium albidum]|uniref:CBU_0592 family membrane protein n=1 Tax=Curtobacterium citreum TaxID=2036 RepID=UPI0020275F31|nr:hypothetical protein [Curtobacterium albidum]MCL9663748.1 hypothetical protein [Curtobacterium albidum]
MLVAIVEFLGWFGAVTVLAGYLLFSLGKIPNGPLYQSLNLVGGLSVAINVAAHHAVPSTIVNGVWAVIAVVVLVRMGRARRAARRGVPETPAVTVLHVEPPTTTAVLPVVGPALRDHEVESTLLDPEVAPAERDHEAEPAQHDRAEPRLQDGTAAPVAPMTESVPVITATIALALVAAAQHHATQEHPRGQGQEQAPVPERDAEQDREHAQERAAR